MKPFSQTLHLTVAVVAAHLLALFGYGLMTWQEEESPRYPANESNPLLAGLQEPEAKDDSDQAEVPQVAADTEKKSPEPEDETDVPTASERSSKKTIAEQSVSEDGLAKAAKTTATAQKKPDGRGNVDTASSIDRPAGEPVADQPALERKALAEGKGEERSPHRDAEAIPRPAREVPLSMGTTQAPGGS